MNTIILSTILFGICIAGMAIGLLLKKKELKKGCSIDPDACTCKTEEDRNNCSN